MHLEAFALQRLRYQRRQFFVVIDNQRSANSYRKAPLYRLLGPSTAIPIPLPRSMLNSGKLSAITETQK
jgi:hypothetical protein